MNPISPLETLKTNAHSIEPMGLQDLARAPEWHAPEFIGKTLALIGVAGVALTATGLAAASEPKQLKAIKPLFYGPSGDRVELALPMFNCPNTNSDAPRVEASITTLPGKDVEVKYQSKTIWDINWWKYAYGCVGSSSVAYLQVNNDSSLAEDVSLSVLPSKNESISVLDTLVTRHNQDGTKVSIECERDTTGKLDCNIGTLQAFERPQVRVTYVANRPAKNQKFYVRVDAKSGDDNPSNNITEIITDVHPKTVDYQNRPKFGFSRYIKKNPYCGIVNIVTKARPENNLYDAKVSFQAYGHSFYKGKKKIQTRSASVITPKGFSTPIRLCRKDNRSTFFVNYYAGNLKESVEAGGYQWNHGTKKFKRVS